MKRILWSLMMVAVMALCSARGQTSSVTAELAFDQEQYLPGEDVLVDLKIYNRSGQNLEFGVDDRWLSFSVQREDGKEVDLTSAVPVKGSFTLRPSEMATKTVNLTPCFDLNKLGRYRVVATLTISQWNSSIKSKAGFFTLINGSPLPGFRDIEYGVPPPAGVSNVPPVMRRYSLLKNVLQNEIRLYYQMKDFQGKPIKTFPIGRMVSFANPEARMDLKSQLHVLTQFGAKSSCYVVMDADGNLVLRQTHDFTQTRPVLRTDTDGRVYVAGGVRRLTPTDFPKPTTTVIPASTNVTIP
jgi:hypothetical protein